MNNTEYIFFDCMETLVDLNKLPTLMDYAAWAYDGSGVENLWEDFDEFFRYYLLAKEELAAKLPEHADYDIKERFLHLVRLSLPGMPCEIMDTTAVTLFENYWRNYKAGCYVKEDVRMILPLLKKHYKMGVVSNFMVPGGIEELLERLELRDYFEFVVTSVAEGWRKPHKAIYQRALELAGTSPGQVVFVGDDYINDYSATKGMGMNAILLDRYNRRTELTDRVGNFYELLEVLTDENFDL
ncbi:MAG: HAD family hydrolase [Acetivibrionales bacterium]|jgi:putative hydrolase of the HAD superfamily